MSRCFCLSISLSVCLYPCVVKFSLCLCISLFLSLYTSVCLYPCVVKFSLCLCISLSLSLYVCLSVFLCSKVLSLSLYLAVSVSLYLCLSVSLCSKVLSLSLYLAVSVSLCFCLYPCVVRLSLSVSVSRCLCLCLSVSLSLSLRHPTLPPHFNILFNGSQHPTLLYPPPPTHTHTPLSPSRRQSLLHQSRQTNFAEEEAMEMKGHFPNTGRTRSSASQWPRKRQCSQNSNAADQREKP